MKRAAKATVDLTKGPIARSAIISVMIRLGGLGLLFLQAMLTGRLLGAEGYGTVAVAMSIAQITATVAMLGLGQLAVREIPRRLATGNPEGATSFTRFAVLATLAFSCTLAAGLEIATASNAVIAPHYRTAMAIGAFLIPPLALVTLLRGLAQGYGNVAGAQVPGDVLRPAVMVSAFGGTFLLGLGATEQSYMHSALAASTVAALAGAAIIWNISRKHPPAPARAHARRRWMAEAMPFLGLGLVGMLQGEINTLLLGWLAGPKEAGLFQPVLRLMPLLALPVQAADMSYAPKVAELWEREDLAKLNQITSRFTVTTTALTALVSLSLAATSPWLLQAFGTDFGPSASLLWYMAAAQIFNAACGPIGTLLNMTGHSRTALSGQLAGLVSNIGIGLWLTPTLGAKGAVLAMVTGVIVCNSVTILALMKTSGITPLIFNMKIPRNTT